MIEFRPPLSGEEARLRFLWKEVFAESDEFIDLFFRVGFSPARCRAAVLDGQIVSMLYWFDCSCRAEKIAYIYGVATEIDHRGQGIARALLENTHAHLQQLGYAGVILVPAGADLFEYYRHLGYQTGGFVSETTVSAGSALPIQEIGPEEYGALRERCLPENGICQDAVSLTFLHGMARLYAGPDFIAAVSREGAWCPEFLGPPERIPGLLAHLGMDRARVRMPGGDKPFSMFLPLTVSSIAGSFVFLLAFD